MPTSTPLDTAFWISFSVQAFAAFATLSAAAVALFGQAFRAKYFPPQLTVELLNKDGEFTTVRLYPPGATDHSQYREEEPRYYHLQVANSRRWSPARETQVFLLHVEVPGPDGKLQRIWSGSAPLGWRHSEISPKNRTIGANADVDLCSVFRGKWLQIHPLVIPHNLTTSWQTATTVVLSLQARSNESDSDVIRMQISWDGAFDKGTLEMRRHLVIAKI